MDGVDEDGDGEGDRRGTYCSSAKRENFNHISISHYSTRILQTQVRRISRSADDKEFGKYWKELPKQMRRVDEEEELDEEKLLLMRNESRNERRKRLARKRRKILEVKLAKT